MRKLRKIRRLILILIVLLLIVLGCYTYFLSPTDYNFHSIKVTQSALPSDFQNFKIAFISDIHIKNKNDLKRFESIIDDLNTRTYDMVLFGGDLYEKTPLENDEVSSLLMSIDSKYGKFAVLGNEDEAHSKEVTSILNEGGFEVLSDKPQTIYYKNSSIELYGLSITQSEQDLKDVKDGYKIVLTHYPDTFARFASLANLQLSGHSGGGYFVLPYFGGIIKDEHCTTYVNGTYKKGNSQLIVNNGLSTTSQIPFKLFARNEILFITLSKN